MNILLWTLLGIGVLALLYCLLCLALSPLYNKAMRSVRRAAKQARKKEG
jgi:hypothetical protein